MKVALLDDRLLVSPDGPLYADVRTVAAVKSLFCISLKDASLSDMFNAQYQRQLTVRLGGLYVALIMLVLVT